MMFPVGGYRKSQIRDLAREFGLRVADKPDSQEICFVSSGDHADFVRRRRDQQLNSASSLGDRAEATTATMTSDTSGEIVLTDGTVVGQHDGIEAFTIGQRKGLRVAMGAALLCDSHRCRHAPGAHRPARRVGAQRTNRRPRQLACRCAYANRSAPWCKSATTARPCRPKSNRLEKVVFASNLTNRATASRPARLRSVTIIVAYWAAAGSNKPLGSAIQSTPAARYR